ncbi:hypothetical protein [Streptomyces youssoufiensis]
MPVSVVRVESLPWGLSMIFDDRPDGLVIWSRCDLVSEPFARMLEKLFAVAVYYWRRLPAGRQRLKAI